MGETKICTKCDEVKPLSEFGKDKSRDGRQSRCRLCANAYARQYYVEHKEERAAYRAEHREEHLAYYREYNAERRADSMNSDLLRHYGITLDDYNAMLEAQDGVCAICGKAPEERERLGVDHNHETGRVRNLLCGCCNRALGQLQDSEQLCLAAAAYLHKWG